MPIQPDAVRGARSKHQTEKTFENRSNSSSLFVGHEGDGTLGITSGGVVNNTWGHIGYLPGSTGEVTVSDSGSIWTNSGKIRVGHDGDGTLNITNGGAVSNTDGAIGLTLGSTGVVTVNGSGSAWTSTGDLYVGGSDTVAGGSGELTVGGVIPGGTVEVSETLKLWSSGTLNIGNGGEVTTGSFDNSAGGTFNFTGGTLTVDGGSFDPGANSLTLDGPDDPTLILTGGASVSLSGGLTVADTESASMSIISGAVSNNHGYIGYGFDSTGDVTVDGNNSTWTNDGSLYVSYDDCQGTLSITDGGVVTNNGSGYIGICSGSTGVVTVNGNGSRWTNNNGLYVGSDNVSGTGELTVSGGGSVNVGGTLKVWGPGTLNIGATGQVTVGEALVLTQGSTLTADAGATIHMTGSAFQNESTNSANLAGLGNLTLIFEGGSGVVDPFEAAGEDAGTNIGGFVETNFLLDTLQLGGVDAGKTQLVDESVNQEYSSGDEAVYVNNLIMNAGATIDLNGLDLYYLNGGGPKQFFCGDATLDGFVDQGDLSIILGGWGQSVPPANPRADLDGDLFVDQADLSKVLCDWGKGVPSGDGGPAPEPTTMLLLALGGLAMLKRRSQRIV